MFYTVYKITNKINNKIYIGKHQTNCLDDDYFGSGKHLKYAINKYGRENFVKEILHVFDNEDEMNTKEAELVTEEFCKRDDTYNICEGGKGGWSFVNREIWDNSKRILKNEINRDLLAKSGSIAAVKMWKSLNEDIDAKENWRQKQIETHRNSDFDFGSTFRGKTHSDEWKKKHSARMKESQNGKKNSQYGTKWSWITNGFENKKVPYVSDDQIPDGWKRGIQTVLKPA